MVSMADKVAYGAGNLATGIGQQIFGSFFVFYATAVLGLPGRYVGTVMGLGILWDAVTDPLMGHLSDRTRSARFGRRHPYLFVGAFGLAAVNYLTWIIDPELGQGAKLAIATACLILFKTFITIYATPYTALGAELSIDYNERTAIQGIKAIFFVLGLSFVSVAGLYWFFQPTDSHPVGQLNPSSYERMGLASSVAIMVSAAVCAVPTLKYVESIRHQGGAAGEAARLSLSASLGRAARNSPFRKVALAYTFSNLSSALLGNLGLIVFTYAFGMDNAQIARVIGWQFLCSVVSQPAWAAVSRRIGKMGALAIGFALSAAGSVYFCAILLARGSIDVGFLALAPFATAAGMGIGAMFTLPLSMVADTVDLDESEHGTRLEGVYFGTMTLMYKSAQALALVGIGILIDASGFLASAPVQSHSTMTILGLALGGGAFVAFAASIAAIVGYPLDEAQVHRCREKIAGRRLPE